MYEDVYDELKTTSKVVGGLSHSDSVLFFRKMKKEKRFQDDTWGIVEKREEHLKKMVEKNYNQVRLVASFCAYYPFVTSLTKVLLSLSYLPG